MKTTLAFLTFAAGLMLSNGQECPDTLNGSVSGNLYNGNQGIRNKQIKCQGTSCPSQCVTVDTCKRSRGNIVNGICLLCKPWEKCLPSTNKCGPNQVLVGNSCVCKPDYERNGNLCQRKHTIITLQNSVQLYGKFLKSVKLNNIPLALLQNGCPSCEDIFLVQVTKSQVMPEVKVKPIPNTNFEFHIEFDFNGISTIPNFQASIQLNPALSRFFDEEDMKQHLQFTAETGSFAFYDAVNPITRYGIMGQQTLNVYNGI